MTNSYDVAVIGAGAMGSSAVYHLAKTGKRILAIDQYVPPHNLGSSYGQSRIIREAYFESPVYVPLVQQAYDLWYQLERESGKKLLLKTGGLMLGTPDSKVVQGAMLSALRHNLPYEYLDSDEIKKRFPGLNPAGDTVGIYEKNAGILFPEECIKTNLELAKNSNVYFHFNEIATAIKSNGDVVDIITNKEKYTTAKLIVSAGAWLRGLFPELRLPLSVARQVLFWFKYTGKNAKNFLPENFPIYIWQPEKEKIFYGFPELGDGIKIAIHHGGKITAPDTIDRHVSDEEISEIAEIVKHFLDIKATFDHSVVCMYTNTPDEDFIIDYHPENKNIIIASPCSGHGFKFSSAIGKLLCDMATEKPLDFDISVFNLARLI
ncbi:MAG TPA: N-methyl-L-tryptophan oxidase [Chitinophagaceae bacterium]|nr:N-methyl-L-tryptophan oxidase [Chitinophagaceae bacterium]